MNSKIAVKRLSEVFKVDSITSSDSDFLATHVPFRNINFKLKSGLQESVKNASEEDIYQTIFCDDSRINEHQFIIVEGSSGAGKSHFIRWINAKLSSQEISDDVIMLIRRKDNTLKGTIKQLLEINEVKNIKNKEIYERLVKANTTISTQKFKDSIFHNFIVEIKNDESGKLNSVKRKNLIALLSNEEFEEKIMQAGGPIDRIFSKVSSDDYYSNQDITALFDVADFTLDVDFADTLEKNSADKRAINMANKLIPEEDDNSFSVSITDYMNSLVDNVVQNCAGIEPGDFQQIFKEIRQELKKNGKGLILLIEDITSFTGINQALLNALITEHTGLNETDDLCRIISVVGTTSEYYRQFRDNYKDRITSEIMINDGAIGENKDDLIQFTAKYLNVLSLESSVIDEWYKKGADKESYPIHSVVEGAEWDYYVLNNNQKLNLYPFTKNAIINLYDALYVPKTPRYILKYIIEKGVSDIIHNKENFPSFCSGFNLNRLSTDDENRIYDIVFRLYEDNCEKYQSRINYFISYWGNNSLISGNDELSGIKLSIFRELGFSKFADRVYVPTESKSEVALNHSETVMISKTAGSSEYSNKEIIKKSEPLDDKSKIIKRNDNIISDKVQMEEIQTSEPPIIISQEEIKRKSKYDEFLKCVREWHNNNGTLFDSILSVRDEICNFIFQTINWQSEGIPLAIKSEVSNSSRKIIAFEGQERGTDNCIILLPRNNDSYKLLVSMGQYIYLGNRSWDFDTASSCVYSLTSWLYKNKKDIINGIKNDTIGNIPAHIKYAMICKVYMHILNDNFKYNNILDLDVDLFFDELKNKKEKIKSGHSQFWKDTLESLFNDKNNEKVYNMVLDYFKTTQGNNVSSSKYLMRYTELSDAIDLLREQKLIVNKEDLTLKNTFNFKNEPKEYLKSILKKIPDILEKETEKANNVYNELLTILEFDYDDEITEDDIKELLEKSGLFYTEIINYGISLIDRRNEIKNTKNDLNNILKDIDNLKETWNGYSELEKLIHFSSDPIYRVNKLLILLKNVISEDVNIALKRLKNEEERLRITNPDEIDYKKQYHLSSEKFNALYSQIIKE